MVRERILVIFEHLLPDPNGNPDVYFFLLFTFLFGKLLIVYDIFGFAYISNWADVFGSTITSGFAIWLINVKKIV